MKKIVLSLCALIAAFLPLRGWCVEKTDTVTSETQLYFVGGGIASLSGVFLQSRTGKFREKIFMFFRKAMFWEALLPDYPVSLMDIRLGIRRKDMFFWEPENMIARMIVTPISGM